MTDEAKPYLTQEQAHAIFTERQERADKKHAAEMVELKAQIAALKEVKVEKTEEVVDSNNPFAKEFSELKSANARILAEMNQQKETAKEANKDLSIRKALASVKAKADTLEHAVVYLKGIGAVKYDSTGDLVMNGLPLADGIKEWAKGDDAKFYLSPKGTAGTGNENKGVVDTRTTLPNGKAKYTKKELGEKILAELKTGELFSG